MKNVEIAKEMERLGYDFEKVLAIMDSERTPDEEETKEFTTVDLENLILNLKCRKEDMLKCQ